jgi:multidrug efflux pump
VIVSGLVALTLSPMMCARLLRHEHDNRLARQIDRNFDRTRALYRRMLGWTLAHRPVVLVFAATVLASIVFLFRAIPQELAPPEDTGAVFVTGEGPFGSTIEHTAAFVSHTEQILRAVPEHQRHFLISGAMGQNSFFGMIQLKPYAERERSAMEVQQDLFARLGAVAGLRINAFNFPSIPGASADLPLKFVLSATGSYELVHQVAEEIEAKAKASGLFLFVESQLRFDKPELRLAIDRDKAAQIGIDAQQIGGALATFLSGDEIASWCRCPRC